MPKRHQQFALAVAVLMLAAGLRLWALGSLPPGYSGPEMQTLMLTENASAGQIRVFERAGVTPQETLFNVLQAVSTSLTGKGLITLRILSVWFGLLTVAAVYALGRRFYTPRAALLAAGLMAVGFWPVLLSRLSMREVLVPFLTAATLLTLANAFHIRYKVSPDPPSVTAYTLLGVTIAASLYAHWFGLFLALIVTVVVIYLFATRQPISRRASGTSIFAVVLSAIVVIPYIANTIRQPDISGLAALVTALGPDSLFESLVAGIAAIFPTGDLSPAFNLPGRPLLGPLSALLFVYALVQGFWEWRRPGCFIPALAAAISLIPLLLSARPGSFRAAVGALPLIYLLVGHGADRLLTQVAQRRPAWKRAVPYAAAALIAANLLWTGADLFNRWPSLEAVRTAYNAERGLLARYLDRTAHEIPTIVCSPRLQDTLVQPGDPHLLALMMQREDIPLRYVDCANGLVLAEGGSSQQFVFTDRAIYERVYEDLRLWLEDQPVVEVPGLASGSVLSLDVADELGDTVGRFLTTAPTGWAPESPGGAGPVTLPARFGGNITFLGYSPPEDIIYPPGGVVPVVTYWRTDGAVPPDLRIFTHLLSDPAAIVTQSSVINVWPPTLRSRDIFIQVSYLTLPESIPADDYDLSIGAYQAESGLRLPVFDGERVRGDRLFLYHITVENPE